MMDKISLNRLIF